LFYELEPGRAHVTFGSQSGPLSVERDGDKLVLDFPANTLELAPEHPALVAALGRAPRELYRAKQWLALYDSEEDVRTLAPNMNGIVATGIYGVIATAPGRDCDFVSRFFAPSAGVPEDPATGSAHTYLTPFWAQKLGKTALFARQLSRRGGELWCDLAAPDRARVRIAGKVLPYLQGFIDV
jgi:predicted PhzF superfamily epimerase YddE/YHI9